MCATGRITREKLHVSSRLGETCLKKHVRSNLGELGRIYKAGLWRRQMGRDPQAGVRGSAELQCSSGLSGKLDTAISEKSNSGMSAPHYFLNRLSNIQYI